MLITRFSLLATLLIATLAPVGCASITAASSHAPPPVEGRPITTWLVELDGRQGHELHARNDGKGLQRITAIQLKDCTNIDGRCGTLRADVVLCPGQSRRLHTVRPRDPRQRFFFTWGFSAHAYEPGEPVVGAACEGSAA